MTGAARRIGRGIALALSEEGMGVALHYHHSASEAGALLEELQGRGARAVMVGEDLTRAGGVTAVMDRVEEALGPVQVLVNNASRFVPSSIADSDVVTWKEDLAIHLEAPAQLCREMARRIPAACEGRIVNMLDWRASGVDATHLAYSVSKAALLALTRNLAAALGPTITVNGVAPGAILPIEGAAAIPEALYRDLPLDRPGRIEDVVQAVLYLIRDAGYTTGAVIPVDGGRHLL